MVDILKLRSKMALRGFNQKRLVNEINARGLKISENTLSSKMTGESSFDCDLADTICEILEVEEPAEKAEIFFSISIPKMGQRRNEMERLYDRVSARLRKWV